MSRLRYDDKINRLDTSAINEGTFVRGRRCNSRANEMKIRFEVLIIFLVRVARINVFKLAGKAGDLLPPGCCVAFYSFAACARDSDDSLAKSTFPSSHRA